MGGNFRCESFITLGIAAGHSWDEHENFSRDNSGCETFWKIFRDVDCSNGSA